jgi:RNA polymerase sigma-70 factor (ECF subfamily)
VAVDLARPPGHAGDLELAERCRFGDMAAFEAMYRAHAPRLFGLASRMVGREQAEDLLQEIFLAAHRKLASYRGDASLGTWLFRLATNLCLDLLRSRRAAMARQTASLDAPDAPTIASSSSGPILGVVDRLDLERALTLLPPGAREVFILHDVEGLEHKEIARLLAMSEGASKSQLHKARRRLRLIMTAGHRPAETGGAAGVQGERGAGEPGKPSGAKGPSRERTCEEARGRSPAEKYVL